MYMSMDVGKERKRFIERTNEKISIWFYVHSPALPFSPSFLLVILSPSIEPLSRRSLGLPPALLGFASCPKDAAYIHLSAPRNATPIGCFDPTFAISTGTGRSLFRFGFVRLLSLTARSALLLACLLLTAAAAADQRSTHQVVWGTGRVGQQLASRGFLG